MAITPAEFDAMRHVEPYQPLVVIHRDGRQFPIPERYEALPFKSNLLVGVDHDPKTGVAETVEFIPWVDIVSIHPIAKPVAA